MLHVGICPEADCVQAQVRHVPPLQLTAESADPLVLTHPSASAYPGTGVLPSTRQEQAAHTVG